MKSLFENYKDILTLIEWPEKMKKNYTNSIIDLNFEFLICDCFLYS